MKMLARSLCALAISGLMAAGNGADAQSHSRDSIPLVEVQVDVPDYAAVALDRFVLVSGPGQRLASVDLMNGRTTPLARVGAGPGEYRGIGNVFACDSTAGWVDRNLRRIVWVAPASGQYLRQLALPAHVTSAGTPVAISCGAGGLWLSMESRTRNPASGRVTDTLTVFRLAPNSDQFSFVMKGPSFDRMVRRRGSLTASLRLPWTGYPHLVPLDQGSVAIVSRQADSITVLSATGARLRAAGIATGGLRLSSAARRLVLDSLDAINEAEMDATQTDPPLRIEARRLHQEMRDAFAFPEPLPTVSRAWRLSATRDLIAVLENGLPGSAQSCVRLVTSAGQPVGRRCFDWSDRQTHSVVSTNEALLWLQSDGDGEAWLLRTPLPEVRMNR